MGSAIDPRSLFLNLEQQRQEQGPPPGPLPTQEPQEQPGGASDVLSRVLGNAQPGATSGAGPDLPIPGNQAMGRLLGSADSAVPDLGGVGDMFGGGMDSPQGIASGSSPGIPNLIGGESKPAGDAAPEQQEQQSGGGFFSRLLGMGRGLIGRFLGR